GRGLARVNRVEKDALEASEQAHRLHHAVGRQRVALTDVVVEYLHGRGFDRMRGAAELRRAAGEVEDLGFLLLLLGPYADADDVDRGVDAGQACDHAGVRSAASAGEDHMVERDAEVE